MTGEVHRPVWPRSGYLAQRSTSLKWPGPDTQNAMPSWRYFARGFARVLCDSILHRQGLWWYLGGIFTCYSRQFPPFSASEKKKPLVWNINLATRATRSPPLPPKKTLKAWTKKITMHNSSVMQRNHSLITQCKSSLLPASCKEAQNVRIIILETGSQTLVNFNSEICLNRNILKGLFYVTSQMGMNTCRMKTLFNSTLACFSSNSARSVWKKKTLAIQTSDNKNCYLRTRSVFLFIGQSLSIQFYSPCSF